MLTNLLKTIKLSMSVIILLVLAGCARTWITSDGRKIVLDDSISYDLEHCDKEIPSKNGSPSYYFCRAAGLDLINKYNDISNGLIYLRKACSYGDYDNIYCCNPYAGTIYDLASKKIIDSDIVIADRNKLYDICINNNGRHLNTICEQVGKLFEEYYPTDLTKATKAYYKLCRLSGFCFYYEQLSGTKIDDQLKDSYERTFDAANKRHHEEYNQRVREENEQNRLNNQQRAEDHQNLMQSLSALNQSGDSISTALQNQNRGFEAIREQNSQREEQQRREKAASEREARDEQRRQSENAANQRREAEENRRHQQQQLVALERSQREEQERQQRQRDEQQRVAQQEADKQRQQQKKQLSCTNMTPSVSGTIKRLKGAGHCDGELAAYLTNNSGIKVTCEQKFERNGVLPGSGSGAQVHIRPGETVGGESGGLWECGHADSDSYKYYCIPADEPYECMRKF